MPIELKLKNYYNKKNHKIICELDRENNLLEISFISYQTEIIKMYEFPRWMEIPWGFKIECNKFINPNNGKFSRTTARQVGYFVKEYFPNLSYSDLKEISESGDFIEGRMDSSRYEFIKSLF